MILKVYAEKDDMMGMRIKHLFTDEKSGVIIASASNNINEPVKMYYEGRVYKYVSSPKFMEKRSLNIKYPLSSNRKKTIGYNIELGDSIYAQFYGEAATCGKRWIFKKNIGFDVFAINEKVFMLYRVGLPNENWHYYCLYDNNSTIVAIIKRHSNAQDYRKATIYIEDSQYAEAALLACTATIVWVGDSGDMEDRIDPSAGPYTSILEEERMMLDKNFIARVEALG